jgi:hypothetical protein
MSQETTEGVQVRVRDVGLCPGQDLAQRDALNGLSDLELGHPFVGGVHEAHRVDFELPVDSSEERASRGRWCPQSHHPATVTVRTNRRDSTGSAIPSALPLK